MFTSSPKAWLSALITEPTLLLQGSSGSFLFFGDWSGGPAPRGGPPGQLQSHGEKCVTHVRHRLCPTAYIDAKRWRSSSVIRSAASWAALSACPLPSVSSTASPAAWLSILITRPFCDATQ